VSLLCGARDVMICMPEKATTTSRENVTVKSGARITALYLQKNATLAQDSVLCDSPSSISPASQPSFFSSKLSLSYQTALYSSLLHRVQIGSQESS
jgi:hypothetical protein